MNSATGSSDQKRNMTKQPNSKPKQQNASQNPPKLKQSYESAEFE